MKGDASIIVAIFALALLAAAIFGCSTKQPDPAEATGADTVYVTEQITDTIIVKITERDTVYLQAECQNIFLLLNGETGKIEPVTPLDYLESSGFIFKYGYINCKVFVQDSSFDYQILEREEIIKTLNDWIKEHTGLE